MIVIKHENEIIQFSHEEIKQKIDIKPFYVVQEKKYDRRFSKAVLRDLKQKQDNPLNQIVYFSPKLSLDYSFIEKFQSDETEFETKATDQDEFEKYLFQTDEVEHKTYNISTFIFSVNPNKVLEIREQINSKCQNEMDKDTENQNIIMIFSSLSNNVYCFDTLEELQFLLKSAQYKSINLIEKGKNFFYRLPTWSVYVEVESLKKVFQSGTNTIKLVPLNTEELKELEELELEEGQIRPPKFDEKYFRAEIASRKDIFPNLNFRDIDSLLDKDYRIDPKYASFSQDRDFLYYRHEYRHDNYDANNYGLEIKTFMVPRDNRNKTIYHSRNGEPSSQSFNYFGKLTQEVWHFQDRVVNSHTIRYYNINGVQERKMSEEWKQGHHLHRLYSKPAFITYYDSPVDDVRISKEMWYVDGKCYSFNGKPTTITYYESGNIKAEMWFKTVDDKDTFYRPMNKPVKIEYYDDKENHIKSKLWLDIDEKENEHGIGYGIKIEFFHNRSIKNKMFMFFRGEDDSFAPHRFDDYPSIVKYYESNDPSIKGKIRSKEWFNKGRKHRLLGPAVIEYDENGNVNNKLFYQDDNEVEDDEENIEEDDNEEEGENKHDENDVKAVYENVFPNIIWAEYDDEANLVVVMNEYEEEEIELEEGAVNQNEVDEEEEIEDEIEDEIEEDDEDEIHFEDEN